MNIETLKKLEIAIANLESNLRNLPDAIAEHVVKKTDIYREQQQDLFYSNNCGEFQLLEMRIDSSIMSKLERGINRDDYLREQWKIFSDKLKTI